MGIRYEDQCVDCPPSMGGCMDCGRKHVPICFCDKCGDELQPEALYDFDGQMLCTYCLTLNFKTVAEVGLDWFES